MAMLGKFRRRRFGEILVDENLINQTQINEALELQRGSGDSLGNILLDLGYITESDIVKALSIQYQIPFIRPSNYDLDRKLIESFDGPFLHRNTILPLDKIGNLLLVVATDVPSKTVLGQLQKVSKCDIAFYLGSGTEVKQALLDLAPISDEDLLKIRNEMKALKEDSGEQAQVAAKESGELRMEDLDLSSEKILSSLDAAWDSIFVEGDEAAEKSESS